MEEPSLAGNGIYSRRTSSTKSPPLSKVARIEAFVPAFTDRGRDFRFDCVGFGATASDKLSPERPSVALLHPPLPARSIRADRRAKSSFSCRLPGLCVLVGVPATQKQTRGRAEGSDFHSLTPSLGFLLRYDAVSITLSFANTPRSPSQVQPSQIVVTLMLLNQHFIPC